MQPYFFVPGTKLQKISTIKELGVEIIIDIEDAVKASDRSRIILELLSNPSHYLEYYVRHHYMMKNSI